MPDGDGALPRGEKRAPAPEVVAVGAPQAMGSVFIVGRFSQRLPAARMQLMPLGVVLTTVQVSFCCEKYTWSRLPFDCSPKATGASSYFLLNCLAISVALWQGIRGLVGAICAASGFANAPQANTTAESRRPGRRIARLLSLVTRPLIGRPAIWPANYYYKVNASDLIIPLVFARSTTQPPQPRRGPGPKLPRRARARGSGERAGHRTRQRFPVLPDRDDAAPAVGPGDHDGPAAAVVGHEHFDQVAVRLQADRARLLGEFLVQHLGEVGMAVAGRGHGGIGRWLRRGRPGQAQHADQHRGQVRQTLQARSTTRRLDFAGRTGMTAQTFPQSGRASRTPRDRSMRRRSAQVGPSRPMPGSLSAKSSGSMPKVRPSR